MRPSYYPSIYSRKVYWIYSTSRILNKLFKDRIAADLDDVIYDAVAKTREDYDDCTGTRRIAITHAVARAWKWL